MRNARELTSLKIRLEAASGSSPTLHLRLNRALRAMILDGLLADGSRLPASRSLASSLLMSRDTVEAAYAQLEAEGVVYRRAGSGTFVTPRSNRLQKATSSHADDGAPARRSADISRRGRTILDGGGVRDQLDIRTFAAGVPETRTFPLATWERVQRSVVKESGTGALAHGGPLGLAPLRRAIADYLNHERGARVTADHVMVLTSSQQALWLCANVLMDEGDQVLTEDPCYHGARKAFDAAGLHCIPVGVDRDGITTGPFSAISSAATGAKAVYLTPSHQYPTGATLALERRLTILEWARTGRWIIEDDYDSEFHYAGRPTACLQGLDRHDRTIYIGTFSKSLFPSLRLAYMVLPEELMQPMAVARTLLDGHTTSINQLTLARFMEMGHFGVHVRHMRALYSARLEILSSAVRRELGDLVTLHLPSGGLQMPCLLNTMAEDRSIQLAARVGIDLPGLGRLYASPPERGGWLMGFAAFTPDELTGGVARLASALRSDAG
ncbi:PLP-dependent aminotransferase family protein [soil metagenome]